MALEQVGTREKTAEDLQALDVGESDEVGVIDCVKHCENTLETQCRTNSLQGKRLFTR